MNLLPHLLDASLFKEERHLRRNTVLKEENTIDTSIYFVKKGSVKISVFQDRQEQIIRFGYDGNLIVALDSFISGKSSDYRIETLKETQVLVAEKKDFMEFVYSNPERTHFYIQLLEQLVLDQLEREKDLLLDSPKERYERVLKRSPQLFQFVPHKFIANYLRMSPETLSRLQKS